MAALAKMKGVFIVARKLAHLKIFASENKKAEVALLVVEERGLALAEDLHRPSEGRLDGTQFIHCFHQSISSAVDFLASSETRERNTKTAFGMLIAEAHRFLNMGRLLLARHAGRPGRHLHASFVEKNHEPGAFALVEGDVADVARSVLAGTIEMHAFDFREQACFEMVP